MALALIWGTSFLLIKIALRGLSPAQLVLGRLGTGALALLGVGLVPRYRSGPGQPRWWRWPWGRLGVVAVMANVVPFLLFAWGEERVSSGLAGLLNGTTPLFTVLAARAALPEEKLAPLQVVGLMVGMAGVVVVLAPWRPGMSAASLVGELACLGAAASYGVGFVYTRRLLSGRGLTNLALATGQLVAATALLGLFAPVVASGRLGLGPGVVGAEVVLGALNTGFAYLLYHFLVKEAGATGASTVTYLVPVVAVALGVVAGGDRLAWTLVVGGATVIVGLVILEGRLSRRRQA